ncbi:hypothetical protein AMTRI_Chr02g213650 [Amborella trichopoda]
MVFFPSLSLCIEKKYCSVSLFRISPTSIYLFKGTAIQVYLSRPFLESGLLTVFVFYEVCYRSRNHSTQFCYAVNSFFQHDFFFTY